MGCLRKILLLLFALRPEAQDRVGVDSVNDHVQIISDADNGHGNVSQVPLAQGTSQKGASTLVTSTENTSGIFTSLPNETISASILLPHAEWPPEPVEQEHTLMQVMMVLAVGGSYAQFFSPMFAVQVMRKRGSVGGRDSGPFVALACACFHWTLYGLFRFLQTGKHRFLVILIGNGPGALLGTYYTIIYWLSCDEVDSLRDLKRFLCATVAVMVIECLVMSITPTRQGLKFFGFMCSMLSSVIGFSTLTTARQVLRTQSVASMPTDLLLTSLLANILWAVISIHLADPFMMFTNGLTIFLALVGLGLTVRFHQRTRWLWEAKGTHMVARELELEDWKSGVFLRTPLNLEA